MTAFIENAIKRARTKVPDNIPSVSKVGKNTVSDHELKIWPPYFEHLLTGRKRFDVRKNDRYFKVGDTIKFRELVPKDKAANFGQSDEDYTGRNLYMRVRYVLSPRPDRDPDCGLVAGYVVLDLEHIDLAGGP
jgi:ribosomal protein S17